MSKKPKVSAANKTLLHVIDAIEQCHALQTANGDAEIIEGAEPSQNRVSLTLPVTSAILMPNAITDLQNAFDTVYAATFPAPEKSLPKRTFPYLTHQSVTTLSAAAAPPTNVLFCQQDKDDIRTSRGPIPGQNTYDLTVVLPEKPDDLFEALRATLKAKSFDTVQAPQNIIAWRRIAFPADILITKQLGEALADRAHYPITSSDKQRISLPLPSSSYEQMQVLVEMMNSLKKEAFAGRPEQLSIKPAYNVITLSADHVLEAAERFHHFMRDKQNQPAIKAAIERVDPSGEKTVIINRLFSDEIERATAGRS